MATKKCLMLATLVHEQARGVFWPVHSLRDVCWLQGLLSDSNPMVVANAVAALAEIHDLSGRDVFKIDSEAVFKLLRAINECTEWGQVCIHSLSRGHCILSCICLSIVYAL